MDAEQRKLALALCQEQLIVDLQRELADMKELLAVYEKLAHQAQKKVERCANCSIYIVQVTGAFAPSPYCLQCTRISPRTIALNLESQQLPEWEWS